MTPRQRQIAALTRNRDFIIRTAFAIGLLFFALGFLTHYLADDPDTSASHHQAQSKTLPADARGIAEKIRDLSLQWQYLSPTADAASAGLSRSARHAGLQAEIENADFDPVSTGLLLGFLDALTTDRDNTADAIAEFEQRHRADASLPLAAGFAAYLHALAGNDQKALELYIAESAHPGSGFERSAALSIATQNEDRETLETLLASPGFPEHIPFHLEDEIFIITGDFTGLLVNQFSHWREVSPLAHVLVSATTGSIWFIIVFQTLGLRKRHLPVAFLAIAAGVFSTALTLWLLAIQKFYTGVELTGSVIDDAVYWFAGVGLREEFAKLACFALLLPLLRGARSDALAFACASYVGLGFAIEENHQYFHGSATASALPRFLTANFLHLSTTGIAGFYLYRLTFGFRNRWEPALGAFLMVVFLHGAYDFLPSTPYEIAREIGIAFIFIIGILAFTHAKMTDELRLRDRKQVVSPLAIFVIGTALILGFSFVVFVSRSASLPTLGGTAATFGQVVSMFGKASLSTILVAFLFINRFRNA